MSFRTSSEGSPHPTPSTCQPFSTSGRRSPAFISATNSWSSARSSSWLKHAASSTSSSRSARGVELSPKLSCWERGEKLLTSVMMMMLKSVGCCVKISKKFQSLQLHHKSFQASCERCCSFILFGRLCVQRFVIPPTRHYANNAHNVLALWYSREVPLKWAKVWHLMTWLHSQPGSFLHPGNQSYPPVKLNFAVFQRKMQSWEDFPVG